MRLRLIAPVLLVLAVTAGGFVATRMLTERDAERDGQHRADIAATGTRTGIEQAENLVESLRRFMLGRFGPDVTNAEFVDVGARWLSPTGLSAAAWVQRVPKPGGRGTSLRATLATGASPMTAPGIDLGDQADIAAAVADPRTLFRVTATPLTRVRDGRVGIFLVESAPRLTRGVLNPGFLVLFLPASWLVAAVTDVTRETNATLQLRVGDTSYGDLGNAATAGSAFSAAGRRFDVRVPQKPIRGAAAVIPWLILGGGILLAVLAGMLAAIGERRARAQHEVDRIFTLSPDLITVAGFDGFWKRVNPAFETHFGYTEREALARPYVDFVHPEDREKTEAAAARLVGGETIVAFDNRVVCKNGSRRWIEWTATPVRKERLLYQVGRDVTDRRKAESEVARLAEEQAALRRVATLVARGVPPAQVVAAVAEEAGRVFGARAVHVSRFEPDGRMTVLGGWSADGGDLPLPSGSSWPLDGVSVSGLVRRAGGPARVDSFEEPGAIADAMRRAGIRSGVGSHIVVEGRLWGAIVALGADEPFPEGAESRLSSFTELVATAIANSESREALGELADEQAALRRVATLVATGVQPAEIFSAVSEEVGRLFGSGAAVLRFDQDAPAVVVVGISKDLETPIGTRREFEDGMPSAEVYRTGRSTRVDRSSRSRPAASLARQSDVVSIVESPIVVEGRLWGAMNVSSSDGLLPPDSEERLEKFTELIATAIANAESKSELAASRRRIVAASDEARRRIERDLHDGTQQRLVTLQLRLAAVKEAAPSGQVLVGKLSEIEHELALALDELRETSRGIHPAVLAEGGLGAALRVLARRSVVPIELDITDTRLPKPIEVAAYFVVSEALTNATKHAQASHVEISLATRNGNLLVSIRDDGRGGADPAGGSGLLGLTDRVEALGGSIRVRSTAGEGTQITAELPLEREAANA